MSTVFQQAADTRALILNGLISVPGSLNRADKSSAVVASVLNTDTVVAYVKFGGSDVIAATTDYPVAAGERVFVSIPSDATHAAVVASGAATGNVLITLGYAGFGNVS